MPQKNIIDRQNYRKKYNEAHKDEILLKNKIYYQTHKDELSLKQKTNKYICECGVELTLYIINHVMINQNIAVRL